MSVVEKRPLGILARFDDPEALLKAARKAHESGYVDFECHSPFPIHGMDEAAGEKRSRVSLVAGILAAIGLIGALAMQGWMSAMDYPLVVSGKPCFSYQAFVPITFAGAVLLAAIGSVMAFMGFMNLKYHHPVFYSEKFQRFSDDGFFISVMAGDPKFDLNATKTFLNQLGSREIEILEGE